MNYAKKYLKENAEALSKLQGADKVALEEKLIAEGMAQAEAPVEAPVEEEKKKGKK